MFDISTRGMVRRTQFVGNESDGIDA